MRSKQGRALMLLKRYLPSPRWPGSETAPHPGQLRTPGIPRLPGDQPRRQQVVGDEEQADDTPAQRASCIRRALRTSVTTWGRRPPRKIAVGTFRGGHDALRDKGLDRRAAPRCGHGSSRGCRAARPCGAAAARYAPFAVSSPATARLQPDDRLRRANRGHFLDTCASRAYAQVGDDHAPG